MERITSLEHLKQEALYDEHKGISEFFILLNGGFRSSKKIIYYEESKTFDVYNDIDDSWEEDLTEEELINNTHIVIAIERNALFKYE